MNKPLGKRSWREYTDEKRRKRQEKIIKKLDKIKEQEEVKSTTAKETVSKPKPPNVHRTCSIAIPGSILSNAQTLELRTYVAGQIARAACIYKVNEIVVFDDTCENQGKPEEEREPNKFCVQFARILQYLECPQYLRKHFFPIHKDLQHIGIVNPLDAPHHLRSTEECEFREGVITEKVKKSGGCYVDVGLSKLVGVNESITPGLRVTVRLEPPAPDAKKLKGVVVAQDTPQKEKNIYWGYSVRIAHSLSDLLLKGPYSGGYDLTIGTSDKGENVDKLAKNSLKKYEHCLIVFGGLKGLESVIEVDEIEAEQPSLLFDYYINTCPDQGSRTIRTEEAVLITLAELRRKI